MARAYRAEDDVSGSLVSAAAARPVLLDLVVSDDTMGPYEPLLAVEEEGAALSTLNHRSSIARVRSSLLPLFIRSVGGRWGFK